MPQAIELSKTQQGALIFIRQLPRTSDAAVALQTDAQMSSRFTPFEIPRWRENDDFRRLLSAFEATLPLRKASDLGQRPIVKIMLSASNGLTGAVAKLLGERRRWLSRTAQSQSR